MRLEYASNHRTNIGKGEKDMTLRNVNLKVDPELWQEAKVESVRQGVKLRDYVTEALKDKIKKTKNKN